MNIAVVCTFIGSVVLIAGLIESRKSKGEECEGCIAASFCSAIFLILYVCFLCWVIGCTVTPHVVSSSQPSFGETGAQNSGLLYIDSVGNRILEMHARDRYNALIAKYGSRFVPPIGKDAEGSVSSTNTFILKPQGEFYFLTMVRWQKQQQPEWAK